MADSLSEIPRKLRKLVIVLGAGASHEFGMPLGSQLKDAIVRYLKKAVETNHVSHAGKQEYRYLYAAIVNVLQNHAVPTEEELPGIVETFVDGLPLAISIDNFLDAHKTKPALTAVGKVAIAYSIAQAEQSSALIAPDRVDWVAGLSETWLPAFFRIITENCTFEDLKTRFRQVSVISFNYDRCLQHFLIHAIRRYYRVNEDAACDAVRQIDFFWPYGNIGALLKLGNVESAASDELSFGKIAHAAQIVKRSQSLKTFMEQAELEEEHLKAIRDEAGHAEKLVFLGFAFHRMNMRLLFGEGIGERDLNQKVFATGFGSSKSDADVISGMLQHSVGFRQKHIIVDRDCKCVDLLSQYRRSLAFEG